MGYWIEKLKKKIKVLLQYFYPRCELLQRAGSKHSTQLASHCVNHNKLKSKDLQNVVRKEDVGF